MPQESPESRVRRPHLVRQDSPFAYTWADIWDASTPEELHAASYGAWLGGMSRHPSWAETTTRTLFLTADRSPDVETMVWWVARVPKPLKLCTCYARALGEGKVIRRSWAHVALDLPEEAAIMLAYHTLGPTIFWSGGLEQTARVYPALGPSTFVDLRDPHAVSTIFGGRLFETLPAPTSAWEVWLQTYGFNPIPEFKRLFEVKQ